MGLETVQFISDLVPTNPAGGDQRSQGDDHIRNIKGALKATFPQISGAVTRTHTQLNAAPSSKDEVVALLGFAPMSSAGGQMTGAFVCDGNVTAFSDERLKSAFRALHPDLCKKIARIKIGEFEMLRDGSTQVGASAQSVRRVLPQLTLKWDGFWAVDYGRLGAISGITACMEIEELKRRIAKLEKAK